jgi:2,4-dienoyl-CoA reductase-like NADH-dependent reductase (Old Yellow Enzyme family)
LIHQFLTPLVNDRDDEYGGSLENRMQLCLRIAKAVRAVVPFPKLVFFRVCCSDWKTAHQFWDLGQW